MKLNLNMRKVWFTFIIVGFVGLTIWIVGSAHKAIQQPYRPGINVNPFGLMTEEQFDQNKQDNYKKDYEKRKAQWKPVLKRDNPDRVKDLSLDVWCIAQRFVEQNLKCPQTVKWPWVSYSKATTNLGNGRYRCASYFDAQNSFGAMVRTNFVCVVKFIGGTQWQLESLRF